MSFKTEKEKAIKAFLKPLGYKYYPKYYKFFKPIDDDIIHSIGYADENHHRYHYYYLRTYVSVASKSLNDILYEVTNGLIDYRDRKDGVGPVYISGFEGSHVIHCEFIGERSMEENIADFEKMLKGDVQRVFDRYQTKKDIYTCAAHDKYYNLGNTPCLWFYAPLAHYFLGEYDEAFNFIKRQIEIQETAIQVVNARNGIVSDETLIYREAYLVMRDNLKKWIAEGRQFKVDDEYLPKLSHFADEDIETYG